MYFEVSTLCFTKKNPLSPVLLGEFISLFDKNIATIIEHLTSLPTIQSQFSAVDAQLASKEFALYFPSFLSFSRHFSSLYLMVFDSFYAIKKWGKSTAFATRLFLLLKTLKDKFLETAILSTSMYLHGEQNRYSCLTEIVGHIHASLMQREIADIPELYNIANSEWHSDFLDFALNFCKCIIGKHMPFIYTTTTGTAITARSNLNQIYTLIFSTCKEFCSIRAQCFANWEGPTICTLTEIFQKELVDMLAKSDLYYGEIGELISNEIKICK